MSLRHALKWSFFSELASKTIQPIVFVVLARLLTPEDYGVMSAALMVIGFSQIFWEAGMGKALIQRQKDTADAANVAFWINIGLGIAIAAILFVTAGSIARTFFHDERVTAVLQVMTLQVFLGSVSAVHTALLQKSMGFKKLFWVRVLTVSLPCMASIPLAWHGMGYWALVAGTLVGQVAQVVMLWRMSEWRPKRSFQRRVALEMVRFGTWVGISGLLAWFYVWADSLIVGMYLGGRELGLYRTGNQFSAMIFAMIFGPITPVLYSNLSRMNQDNKKIGDVAEIMVKALTFIAVPIGIVVFSVAGPIGDSIFGSEWQGIGAVIGIMALMHGFSWVVGMNGEFYRAMGKPSYETIVTATTLLIYLGVYLYSIRYGFDVFLWARLGLALGALVIHLFVMRKVLKVRVWAPLGYVLMISMVCGLAALLVKKLFTDGVSGPWWKLIGGGSLSCIAVAMALFIIERNGMFKEIKSMINGRSA